MIINHEQLQDYSSHALRNLLLLNGVVSKLMKEAEKTFEESIEFVWRQENIESAIEEGSFKKKKRITTKPDVRLKLKKSVVIQGERLAMPMLTFGVFNKELVFDFHEDLINPLSLDLDFIVDNPFVDIRKKYWPTYRYHAVQINKLNRVSFHVTKLMKKFRDTCIFFTQKHPVESVISLAEINALIKQYKSSDNALFNIVDSCYDLSLHLNEGLAVITKAEKKAYDDETKITVENMKYSEENEANIYSLNPVLVVPKESTKAHDKTIRGRVYCIATNIVDLRHYKKTLTNKKPVSTYIKRKKSFSKGFYYPIEFITHNKNYYLSPVFIPFVERIVESTNFLNDKNSQLNKYRKELLDLILYLDDNRSDFISDD